MHLLSDKIRKLNIGWNERPLDEADFYRLCKRLKVSVTEMPLKVGGFYYRAGGRDFIAIDCGLAGPRRLAVLFHELAHFLFHAPESGATANFHGVGRRTRKETEADVFALVAIMPRELLRRRTPAELIEDGIPAELVGSRQHILMRYGL